METRWSSPCQISLQKGSSAAALPGRPLPTCWHVFNRTVRTECVLNWLRSCALSLTLLSDETSLSAKIQQQDPQEHIQKATTRIHESREPSLLTLLVHGERNRHQELLMMPVMAEHQRMVLVR